MNYTYTNDFLAAVKHLNNYVLERLHPAMVAQWILESDRGNSKLARDAKNFAGMKWRKELSGIGLPILIDVPSEPYPMEFAAFATPQDFVRGFYKFLDREPYAGWRNTVSPEQYIEHIGSTWAADPDTLQKSKHSFQKLANYLKEKKQCQIRSGSNCTASLMVGHI